MRQMGGLGGGGGPGGQGMGTAQVNKYTGCLTL